MRHRGSVQLVEAGMDPPLPVRMEHPNVFTFYFKELDAGPEQRLGPWCQLGRVAAATRRATHPSVSPSMALPQALG